jgi:CopC domain-containing protein
VVKHTFQLAFNGPLDSNSSWAEITSPDGARMDSSAAVDSSEPRRLSVRLLEPTAGSFDLHWHVEAADSHLASDGDAPFTLQPGAATPPRIDISPAVAESGDRLELVGKGYPHEARVPLTIGDDDQPLVVAETDASGQFNLEAHVPSSVPYGLQRVSSFDGINRTATTTVQVRWGGWPPLVGTDTGSPGPDPGEVTFTVTIRNRSDYVLEHVHVVMADPEGGEIVSADPGAQREDLTLAWDIPVMERGQSPPFHVTYRTDHAVVSHSWFEFRHRRERGCNRTDCLPAFISNSVADSEATAPRL